MRKIEQEISDAVLNGCRFSGGNTVVATSNSKTECFLHGNKVFQLDRKTWKFKWSDCGWKTRTTASRLNACFDAVHSLTDNNCHYNYKKREVLDTSTFPHCCIMPSKNF